MAGEWLRLVAAGVVVVWFQGGMGGLPRLFAQGRLAAKGHSHAICQIGRNKGRDK